MVFVVQFTPYFLFDISLLESIDLDYDFPVLLLQMLVVILLTGGQLIEYGHGLLLYQLNNIRCLIDFKRVQDPFKKAVENLCAFVVIAA